MKLTKEQRATLKAKFGGRCAYCGIELGDRWHADHFEPVQRELKYISGQGLKATGKLERPERDTLANMMPACGPCNIDKHSMSLEQWRGKLGRAPEVLGLYNPTYRHAIRFGLVIETQAKVTFFFERQEALAG